MSVERQGPIDLFSATEVARAAGVPLSRVQALLATGNVPTGPAGFLAFEHAVQAVRLLGAGLPGAESCPVESPRPLLFSHPEFTHVSVRLPIAAASTVHLVFAACMILVASLGLSPQATSRFELLTDNTHLIFLAQPGPGGGGGGGGLRQHQPPPRAQREGIHLINSPVPPREEPKPVEAIERPVEPPKAPEIPPIVAPVVAAPADQHDRAGLIDKPAATDADSRGPGEGGGAGDGRGTGLGSGDGSGIGPGSGGGIGGGPYRPGSGVTAPRLLDEVKADYTEAARQRSIEGVVLLEVVVRQDGSVGEVRLVKGLPDGLNERAIQAVRQWRFSPSRRFGQPVDVMVEVVVEFKLR